MALDRPVGIAAGRDWWFGLCGELAERPDLHMPVDRRATAVREVLPAELLPRLLPGVLSAERAEVIVGLAAGHLKQPVQP
jgi:hypothetical protein